MEYLIYVLVLFAIVGLAMLAFGVKEAQDAKHNNPVVKLQRMREQRGSVMAMGMDEELEAELQRKFARDEETRAVAAKKERHKILRSVDEATGGIEAVRLLDIKLQQIDSLWRASDMIVAAILAALVVLTVCYWSGFGWWSLVPAVACIPLPWIYAKTLRKRYFRRFDEQLADTLMLMSNSLRAGFSFMQAMEMIAREAPFPIGREFQGVAQEIALGVPISQALDSLAERINSPDLDLMVTAVNIQRETGGALAEILDVIARVIAERMVIRGEIQTLTAQGRLTGAVLSLLPIILGLLIHIMSRITSPYDPSFVEPLIADTRGHIMLAGGVIVMIIGGMWIMKIVTIKV